MGLAFEWVAQRVATGELSAVSARTVCAMLKTLTVLEPQVAHPSELTADDLLKWQATTGHYSPAYRAHMLSTMRGWCAWLMAEGHLTEDPTTRLAKVRQPRSVPRALSPEQAQRVLDATANQRDRTIIKLMLQMGLRCIEVVRLDYGDWDQQARTLHVRGKGNHERVIPVTFRAQAELAAWIAIRGDDPGPLIRGYSPRSPKDGRVTTTWLSTHISRLMTAAGVHEKGDRFTAHALRHTAASDVLDRCHDLRVVQEMLGHQSLAATQVYLRRADMSKLRAAMEGRDYSEPA